PKQPPLPSVPLLFYSSSPVSPLWNLPPRTAVPPLPLPPLSLQMTSSSSSSSCSLKCDPPFVCEIENGQQWCLSPSNFVNLQKIMSDKKNPSTTPFPLPTVLYRSSPTIAPSPYYEPVEPPSNSLFTAVAIALLGFITVSLIAIFVWHKFCRHNPAWSTRPRQPVPTESPDALIVEKQ
ncbi:hypothetical protein PMAYCL1PPCAC_13478, partial [Pristionchus mayeri]